MAVEIRTVKHADEIEQLTELPFSTYRKKISKAYWEWAYLQNPLAGHMPEVTVAIDGSKIVGIRPFWLTDLWVGDSRVTAAQHCDTLVHPDYRRQGIFNRMGKFAFGYLREHDCGLTYGFPGPMSRRGFLSQGYRVLTPLELSFRLLKPGRIISRYTHPKMVSTRLGNLIDRFYTPGDVRLDNEAASQYQVVISDGFTPDLAGLDSIRDAGAIGLVRSEINLRWRFDNHPHFKYRYIAVKKQGELCGYAVIQNFKEYSGLLAGLIMDYVVRDGNLSCFRSLVAAAMGEFKKTGCYVMSVWAFSEPDFQRELHHNLGFKSANKFPYRKIIDTGYMDVLSLGERHTAGLNVYDPTKWRITYAYPNFF